MNSDRANMKKIFNPHKLSKNRVKTRFHKQLFEHDSPYGHRVHKDKTKRNPRKDKYKQINIDMEED